MFFLIVFVSPVILISAHLSFPMNLLAVLAFTVSIPSERTLMFRLDTQLTLLFLEFHNSSLSSWPKPPYTPPWSKNPPLPSCCSCLCQRFWVRWHSSLPPEVTTAPFSPLFADPHTAVKSCFVLTFFLQSSLSSAEFWHGHIPKTKDTLHD